MMENTYNNEKLKALLVGVNVGSDPDFEAAFSELFALTKACDMEVVTTITQNVDKVNTGVYVGTGKVEEIKAVAHMLEADVVVFDNSLSPMQLRNLKDIIERPVFDRTHLILQIFSTRARTKAAKLQVECARLSYELPRLTGMGTILSRQGGASGSMSGKGAGEKKLELDKRHIRDRISELKRELKEVEKNRETQRKKRVGEGIPLVSLVGYTNAGKSTIMNAFIDRYDKDETKKEGRKVEAKNMLFATLDTTVRKIALPDKKEFLLSDTVGFINKLPHGLVEAFHSTLEEVQYADLLLQVIDYSDPHYAEHINVTNDTLKKLGAANIPCIYIYNKSEEKYEGKLPFIKDNSIYMAAGYGIGIEELIQMISERVFSDYVDCTMLIPYDKGSLIGYFNENATIKSTEYTAEGTKIEMSCLLKDLNKYKEYFVMTDLDIS